MQVGQTYIIQITLSPNQMVRMLPPASFQAVLSCSTRNETANCMSSVAKCMQRCSEKHVYQVIPYVRIG